ncbi:hypothetical protein HU200_023214 [Digitaria exilis]|uniref:RING-type E3 ubiquitin transferase n=1 Tax=Digitaria exilis TaxID=1010633 RepID=A0A835CD06_9POAL|nr:hypothetical protein HU200_023214 [Digitaria exilis]
MDPPPAPLASTSSSSSTSPPTSSSSSASVTMVIITVVGIFAAFALLGSYYAFVTKCQLLRALWSRNPPWRRRPRVPGGGGREPSVIRAGAAQSDERRGLGLPLIRMLPVVKFTAAACGGGGGGGCAGGVVGPRISVSECAVCLSEFVERERVRLLPNCSHAFHIDCIDTWLQGSARCPFCRSDVTLPAARWPARSDESMAAAMTTVSGRRDTELAIDSSSIVIEVRGEQERWVSNGGGTNPAASGGGRRPRGRQKTAARRKAESVGDEAIETRKTTDEEFAVQPLRRSLSLDSCCDDKQRLYVSVQEFLAARRQVLCDPSSVHS